MVLNMSDLPEYERYAYCAKCNTDGADTRYCTFYHTEQGERLLTVDEPLPPERVEHFDRQCRNCGYVWYEATLNVPSR